MKKYAPTTTSPDTKTPTKAVLILELPTSLKRQLETHAKAIGESQSAVVRTLLRNHLNPSRTRQPNPTQPPQP